MADGELVDLILNGDQEEHFRVLLEALHIYVERDAVHDGLWKVGAADSANHMRHKTFRCDRALRNVEAHPEQAVEEALDLINYAAFYIRNVREGRLGNGSDGQ